MCVCVRARMQDQLLHLFNFLIKIKFLFFILLLKTSKFIQFSICYKKRSYIRNHYEASFIKFCLIWFSVLFITRFIILVVIIMLYVSFSVCHLTERGTLFNVASQEGV